MQEFPDPTSHLERHMEQAAEKYVDGLEKAGLEPNPTLTRAMAERALLDAQVDYIHEATATRDHNIALIVNNHKRRMKQIKREGASLRIKTCPPIILLFGLMAWYSLIHAGGIVTGILFIVGALAFLAMLILGPFFDR